MKLGIAILSVLLVSNAFAGTTTATGKTRKPAQATLTCPAAGTPGALDKTVALVNAAQSCYDASNIATQCAWGSSADIQIAGAATTICEKDFPNMTAPDKALYKSLDNRCGAAYSGAQDSISKSAEALCNLSAARFFSDIYNSGNPN